MSNFARAAYHPKEKVVRAAIWIDDHFGRHEYGVSFDGDQHVYRPEETSIPLDVVFVPASRAPEAPPAVIPAIEAIPGAPEGETGAQRETCPPVRDAGSEPTT